MPINTALLVTTNDLQQYFVDKDTGLPLSAGVVTLYEDSSRTTLKNWYYQSGVAPAYTYIALPNPLTLSAVGTIKDINGNDTLPFYFPFSEINNSVPQAYYITVLNSNGERQFVRQNFPFNSSVSGGTSAPTNMNYIVNNNFWRGTGSQTGASSGNLTYSNPLQNVTQMTICPSQHDGFSFPDWQFFKDVAGANDTLTFTQFPFGTAPFMDDVRPEWYINHTCTSVGTESVKYYQVPIALHINNLDTVTASFTIQAMSAAGSVNNQIQIYSYQFLGTGASPQPEPVLIATYNLTGQWKKYVTQFIFASSASLSSSGTGDDAFYIQIGMPTQATCNISFAVPSLYLSDAESVPSNNMATYDQTDAIINSPRTGDFKFSASSLGNLGYVAANDGTIGSGASAATTRNNMDTWPLYNYIWNNYSQFYAPVNPSRGTAAYLDFVANKPLSLTKVLGRSLVGVNQQFSSVVFTATVTTLTFSVTYTVSTVYLNFTGGTFTVGQPVQLSTTGTLPTGLSQATTYYISSAGTLSATQAQIAANIQDAINGVNSVTFSTNGTGTQSFVNTTNALTLASSQPLTAGTPVLVSNSGGGLPSGLTANTIYYVSSNGLTSTTAYLSNNYTDAVGGYFIGIQTAGTGTQTMQSAAGAYNGASYTTEVAAHVHTFTKILPNNAIFTASVGDKNFINSGGNVISNLFDPITDSTGVGEVPIIPPSALVNVSFKL